jgi:hypothetical protein
MFFFFLKKIIWKKQLVSDTEDLNYRNLSDYSSDCFFKCFLLGNILKYFFKKNYFYHQSIKSIWKHKKNILFKKINFFIKYYLKYNFKKQVRKVEDTF